MLHFLRVRVFGFIGAILLMASVVVTSAGHVGADEPLWKSYAIGRNVAVTLMSGRVVKGEIDPRTTAAQLWLVARADRVSIGCQLTARDVTKIEAADAVFLPEPGHLVVAGHPTPPSSVDRTMQTRIEEQPPVVRPAVKSLGIGAELANWDADAEPDGLRLFVAPRDAQGNLVPVRGSLSVDLAIYRGKNWPHSRGAYRDAEEWSEEITVDEFGQYGAVVELPFRQTAPETDREFYPLGVLRARFNVAGQGSFDAVLHEVLVRERPLHPMR